MSYRFRRGAIFALILSASALSAACGDVAETATSGSAGGGDAASTAATIVGPGSTGSAAGGEGGSGDGGGTTSPVGAGGEPSGSGGGDTGGADGGGGGDPAEACPDFANEVVDIAYGPGAGYGQEHFPSIVFGGPHGFGEMSGSLHVLALGNGGSITLGFTDRRIVDGQGADFIVFENAFWAGGDPDVPYAELGAVEVSADGETWIGFPCSALEAPFGSCAGWNPVYANVTDNDIDPLDATVAGGDAFDLADVGLAEARYVRIVDRADQGGVAGIFDLDAVAIVHGRCDAE